jgi:hypothetical protein
LLPGEESIDFSGCFITREFSNLLKELEVAKG